ncbi:MAG: hypothetical protein IJ220_07880 [Clostridia bacterium]|nr:hypothetical protein [Clostridia bacterium]
MQVNFQVESDQKPNKYMIENILNNECDIILNDNITKTEKTEYNSETGKEEIKTIYKFDSYRLHNIYRDNLDEELSTTKGFKIWLNFAKKQYAEQIVEIPDSERIAVLEQAIIDIGEVIGNG